MRVRIEESKPGELTALTSDELEAKVSKAVGAVLKAMAQGDLVKAEPPPLRKGGEVRVLDDLGELIVQEYEARMGLLKKAILETASDDQG